MSRQKAFSRGVKAQFARNETQLTFGLWPFLADIFVSRESSAQ